MTTKENQERATRIVMELANAGKLVEGGWRAMVILSDLEKATEIQRQEMRKAFFFGAQHVLASMTTFLEGGTDATPADLHKMDLLYQELKTFTDTEAVAWAKEHCKKEP